MKLALTQQLFSHTCASIQKNFSPYMIEEMSMSDYYEAKFNGNVSISLCNNGQVDIITPTSSIHYLLSTVDMTNRVIHELGGILIECNRRFLSDCLAS